MRWVFFLFHHCFYISNHFWISVISFIMEDNLPLFHLKYLALVTFHHHRFPSPLKVASGFSSCSCALCLLEEPRETGQEPTLTQSPEICELPVRHCGIREVNCQTEKTEADNHKGKKIKEFSLHIINYSGWYCSCKCWMSGSAPQKTGLMLGYPKLFVMKNNKILWDLKINLREDYH